jgi:hypothetical protein
MYGAVIASLNVLPALKLFMEQPPPILILCKLIHTQLQIGNRCLLFYLVFMKKAGNL